MNTQAIEHQGKINSITGNCIEVEIQTSSACVHCSATDQCVSADNKTRKITVEDYIGPELHIGENVHLKSVTKNGLSAVFYAYFLPFLIVIAALFIANALLNNEALAGLIALGTLVPYYFVIWLLKDRFKKRYAFKIIL